MANFTTIPDSDVDQDSPGTVGLFTALRDNPIAIIEGASTAPRILGRAIARETEGTNGSLPVLAISASDAVTLESGLARVQGFLNRAALAGEVTAFSFTNKAYTGTVRFKASHVVSPSGNSRLRFYKNGGLVATWNAGTVVSARSIDVAVAVGDTFEWRHEETSGTSGNTSTVSAVSESANDGYVEQKVYIQSSAQ